MTFGDQYRILVADDNDAGRYATARTLRQAGFEVIEAETGAEALHRVTQDSPDLVLLDVYLPDMNGVDVCRRIKSGPATAATLVLQMSASAVDDHSRVKALDGGADAYIESGSQPNLLLATVRSLLRIRTAELALQDAALEWQATFDAIRDGVALLDDNGVIRRWNVALPALLGREAHDVAGRRLDDLIPGPPGDPPLLSLLMERQARVERALGDRTFSITAYATADSADRPHGCVAIVTDITERKLLDEQLRHTQKLESIGLLAGGVAHDFNNLLMGILGNASLALDSLDSPGRARALIEDVTRAAERAAELTRQMLAYAGKGRFVTEPLDLSALVQDLVPLIQSSIPRKVALVLNLGGGLPAITADKAQVEQLVMNLIINAGESIDAAKGSVIVTTAARQIGADELSSFLTDHRAAGDYVALEVRDTGVGMDEETLKRIFDPFFSTKFLGRGMGLAAALGILRSHRGAVKVTSTPGHGTTFRILFPATSKVAVAPPPEETAIATGSGTLLVADDEETVRNVLQRTLERAGYNVLLAENGADALGVFARNANRISLVILDLVMPVMSGEEVLPHLLTMKPDVKIIVSSGQDEDECMPKLRDWNLAGFLQKPYRPAALAAKVQKILRPTRVAGGDTL